MLEAKKVTLEDNGQPKTFTIKPLAVIPALMLIREVSLLLVDTNLLKSVVMQQILQNILKTGVKVDGVQEEDLHNLLDRDTPEIIASLIQSIIYGLDDGRIQSLVDRCMSAVIFHNGTVNYQGDQLISGGLITDPMLVIALIREVFVVNFSGAISRLKKLLFPNPSEIVT